MTVELAPEATQVIACGRLGFTLVNHGPGSIMFGQLYTVQREQDGA